MAANNAGKHALATVSKKTVSKSPPVMRPSSTAVKTSAFNKPVAVKSTSSGEPAILICAKCDTQFNTAWALCVHCTEEHSMSIYKKEGEPAVEEEAKAETIAGAMSTLNPPVHLENPSNKAKVDYIQDRASQAEFNYPAGWDNFGPVTDIMWSLRAFRKLNK